MGLINQDGYVYRVSVLGPGTLTRCTGNWPQGMINQLQSYICMCIYIYIYIYI